MVIFLIIRNINSEGVNIMSKAKEILLELNKLKAVEESSDMTIEHKGYLFTVDILSGGKKALIKNTDLGVRTSLDKEGNYWVNQNADVRDTELDWAVTKLLKKKV